MMNVPDMDQMDDLELLSWYTGKVVEIGRMKDRDKRDRCHDQLITFKKKMNARFKENLSTKIAK